MTTDTADTIADPQAPAGDECFVFDHADWAFYELVLRQVGDRHVFVTFDGERLEVMSPSFEHDKLAERLAQLVRFTLLHQRVPFQSAGSFTLKKQKASRGLEPDRCFYIQNVASLGSKRTIDLKSDPPPDLAIEVEISRRLLDRIDVYRRLGVPEVWCYDGHRLRILRLGKDGYEEAPRSPTLPDLPPDEAHRLVQRSWDMDELAWTEMVLAWLSQNVSRR